MKPGEAADRPAAGDRAAAAGAKTPPQRSKNAALRVRTVRRPQKKPVPSPTACNEARRGRGSTRGQRTRRRGGRQNATEALQKRRAARADGAQTTGGASPVADALKASPERPRIDPRPATAPPRRAPKRRSKAQKSPHCTWPRSPDHRRSQNRRRPPEEEPGEATDRSAAGARAAAAGAKTPPRRSKNAALLAEIEPGAPMHGWAPPAATRRPGGGDSAAAVET